MHTAPSRFRLGYSSDVRYAVTFGTASMVSLLGAWLSPWWLAAPALWIATSMGVASAAYSALGPGVLGKRPDGRLAAWSYVVNGPFLLLGLLSMRLVNRTSGEAPFHQVAPGILLGRRPSAHDGADLQGAAPVAVLDLCAELPRSRLLTGEEAYLSVPVLDGTAPTRSQLRAGVAFIDAQRAHGPVLVHCALGHSRSATVVIAWQLARTHVADVDIAEARLQAIRSDVGLTPPQRAQLRTWSQGPGPEGPQTR